MGKKTAAGAAARGAGSGAMKRTPRDLLTARLRTLKAVENPKQVQISTHIVLRTEIGVVAGFVMGAGFTKEIAEEMARRCNAHEDLVAAVKALLKANTFGMSVTGGWDQAAEDPLYVQCGEADRMGRAALTKAGRTP